MRKQKKQLIFMVVLLLVLGGAFLGLSAYEKQQTKIQEMEEQKAEEEEELIVVSAMDTEEITEFSYLFMQSDITFVKENGNWSYVRDKSIPIDQEQIQEMLSYFSELTAEDIIEDPDKPRAYGFEEPINVITVKTAEDSYTVTIGMKNEFFNKYYMMVEGDDRIYLIDNALFDSFDRDVYDLRLEETEEPVDVGTTDV